MSVSTIYSHQWPLRMQKYHLSGLKCDFGVFDQIFDNFGPNLAFFPKIAIFSQILAQMYMKISFIHLIIHVLNIKAQTAIPLTKLEAPAGIRLRKVTFSSNF